MQRKPGASFLRAGMRRTTPPTQRGGLAFRSTVNLSMHDHARLLIHCPDQHGLVAAVSNFLYHQNANVTDAQQHATAPEGGHFFMRMAFVIEGLARRQREFEVSLRRRQ